MATKKETVVKNMESSWTALRSVIESVPEEELEAAGVVEEWSVKDIVGHLAFWDWRAATTLRAATANDPDSIPRGEGDNWVDEWNEREYKARKDKPFGDVRGEWIKSHEDVRRALEDTPESALDKKYGPNKIISEFEWDTYTHYDQHAEQIKAWLREMETTEK
jgi:hypothetical protein